MENSKQPILAPHVGELFAFLLASAYLVEGKLWFDKIFSLDFVRCCQHELNQSQILPFCIEQRLEVAVAPLSLMFKCIVVVCLAIFSEMSFCDSPCTPRYKYKQKMTEHKRWKFDYHVQPAKYRMLPDMWHANNGHGWHQWHSQVQHNRIVQEIFENSPFQLTHQTGYSS